MVENWVTEEVQLARANLFACAYNAAVNYGSGRAHKKMVDLIEAINDYERIVGRAKLQYLVDKGIIDGFTSCPHGCEMRPGGLFHVEGCQNEMNNPIRIARCKKAEAELPGKENGYWIGAVSLVG